MMVPTIHLNGTSREELVKELQSAHQALTAAASAMSAACPNGRDYYVQGPGAPQKAIAEHRARLAKLAEIQDEIYGIWEGILDQRKGG